MAALLSNGGSTEDLRKRISEVSSRHMNLSPDTGVGKPATGDPNSSVDSAAAPRPSVSFAEPAGKEDEAMPESEGGKETAKSPPPTGSMRHTSAA